jgi:hypothetical protein
MSYSRDMWRRQIRRKRARLALAAIALWLAGLEVLPNLHVALHDQLGAHTHVGDATVFVASHRHADGSIHALRRPRTRAAREAHLAAALAHGQHSLAHRTAGVAPSAPPIIAPIPVDRPTLLVAAIAESAPSSRRVSRASARGPPASSI